MNKSEVWKGIFRLILPFKKRFLLVVFIGLLSTGANLVEPLIYREAVNDIAGLFVQQAKDSGTPDNTATAIDDEDDDPLSSLIENGFTKGSKEPHRKNYVAGRSPEQALRTLLFAAALLFFINLLKYIFWLIGDNLNVRLSCTIEQRFIQNTFSHVLKLPLTFFSKRSSAALSKQINQSDEVSGVVNGFSQEILPEIISLTGILVIMMWQNVTLTLISLAVIPVYIILAWSSANRLESGLASYYEKWEEVSTSMQDALGGIKTVKLSGAEDREGLRLKSLSDGAYDDYVRRAKLANKYVFIESMLTRLSMALVLGYGGYLTLKHQLTPGDVVMFVAYLDRLYDPIDALASLWVNLQQNVASIARALKLLNVSVDVQPNHELNVQVGKIEFKNVNFSYNKEREILKDLSMTISPGKITAIIGPSGAGKTTAVDLIMKLYEPSSGQILIDGQDLSQQEASSIRRQIGTVAADGAVFRGTLADNIRYKRPHATDEEVMAAAISAGMEGTLKRLPEGLKTPVGESGFGLSVGERQRIQIARVLVSQPRILILDEATANLDYATEKEVKKTINNIRKENTVIIIAHRYAMVRDADHVIVLAAGNLQEQGSPEELLAKGGWFASFAQASADKKNNRAIPKKSLKDSEGVEEENEEDADD
jgi:ATP-binding cassette, subfamily B, bacterial